MGAIAAAGVDVLTLELHSRPLTAILANVGVTDDVTSTAAHLIAIFCARLVGAS